MRISLSATPVLYHLTGVTNVTKILKNNRFELKPSDGTTAEELANAGGAYYLSTTRSKLGAYTLKSGWSHSAIIVLSGTKISQRHKIRPLDYWGTNELTPSGRAGADEAEDRVMVKQPMLKAIPYILEIHAHTGEKAWALKRECVRNKIPVFFYDNKNSMILMDKRKAVPVSMDEPKAAAAYVKPRNLLVYDYQDQRKNALSGWMELQMTPLKPLDVISDKAKTLSKFGQMAYKILRYDYNDDALNRINADLHNAKSMEYGSIRGDRESLDKLVALMRKNQWTVKMFIKQLYDKWYPRK
jgi:hypothetical protein